MLDFEAVRRKEISFDALIEGLSRDDLEALTNEMIDVMLEIIADAVDEDVVFEPEDPGAHDPEAATEAETAMPWTLGHVIVHTTSSGEEAAFLAAELARGVPVHGRSRSEVHWTSMHSVSQCRHRLEESRRMRLASLGMWPDEPYLDNTYTSHSGRAFDAYGRFVLGLAHDTSHLGQLKEIMRQARAARTPLLVNQG